VLALHATIHVPPKHEHKTTSRSLSVVVQAWTPRRIRHSKSHERQGSHETRTQGRARTASQGMSEEKYNIRPGDKLPMASLSLDMATVRDHVTHSILLNQNAFRNIMVECVKNAFDRFDFQREVNRAFDQIVSQAVQEGVKEYFLSGPGESILEQAIDQAVKASFKKAST